MEAEVTIRVTATAGYQVETVAHRSLRQTVPDAGTVEATLREITKDTLRVVGLILRERDLIAAREAELDAVSGG